MAFLFLSYLVTFLFVWKHKKKWAYAFFALSTTLSILMFLYHATSTLNLNF